MDLLNKGALKEVTGVGPETFTLALKNLHGPEGLLLAVTPKTTVSEVKQKVEEDMGVPFDLGLFDGKDLFDSDTLEASGVKDGSIIHLVLRGGGAGGGGKKNKKKKKSRRRRKSKKSSRRRSKNTSKKRTRRRRSR